MEPAKNPKRPPREVKNIHRRAFEIRAGASGGEGELWAEGRAATFDNPTVLFELDGLEYRSRSPKTPLAAAPWGT